MGATVDALRIGGTAVNFITASGITKAVGRFLILHLHVSDFWKEER